MNEEILKDALNLTADTKILENIPTNLPEINPSDSFLKKLKHLLKKYNKPMFKLTYTTPRKAVCILVAILTIMFSSLSVGAVRDAVKDFFVNHFSIFATIDYNEKDAENKDYPKKIEEVYELGNLPEGYKVAYYSETDNSIDTIYKSEDGDLIALSQNTKETYSRNYDNEDFVITQETYDNKNYMVVSSEINTEYIIIWDNGDYILTLSGSLNKQEIFKLCNSIKIKE